jgi:hypothetical protein
MIQQTNPMKLLRTFQTIPDISCSSMTATGDMFSDAQTPMNAGNGSRRRPHKLVIQWEQDVRFENLTINHATSASRKPHGSRDGTTMHLP